MAATVGVISVFMGTEMPRPSVGQPRVNFGTTKAMLYQKMIWIVALQIGGLGPVGFLFQGLADAPIGVNSHGAKSA